MQTWEELKIDALVRLPETLDLEAAGTAHPRGALPLAHGAHCGTAPQRTKGSRHCGADCTTPPAMPVVRGSAGFRTAGPAADELLLPDDAVAPNPPVGAAAAAAAVPDELIVAQVSAALASARVRRHGLGRGRLQ